MSVYTPARGARNGVSPVTIIITDGWATPTDPASVVNLANTARQQINGLQVYVVALGPTAHWHASNIIGMAGSADHVTYVESTSDIDTAVNKILNVLC